MLPALLALAGPLVERLVANIPDPAAKEKARADALAEVMRLAATQDAAQADINKVEAASSSVFVAGWRPAVGWVCVTGVGYAFVARPLLSWVASVAGWPVPPPIETEVIMGLLTAILGVGGLRTAEKIRGVAR